MSGHLKLQLLKANKQYNRYPGLLKIIKLEHFLKYNKRYQKDIPYKTINAILYSVRTKVSNRNTKIWDIVKKSAPISTDWKYIAAYGNPKTMNIKLIDFSILYKDEEFIQEYPHIKNYLLREISC